MHVELLEIEKNIRKRKYEKNMALRIN